MNRSTLVAPQFLGLLLLPVMAACSGNVSNGPGGTPDAMSGPPADAMPVQHVTPPPMKIDCTPGAAHTYDVGTDQTLKELADVPWSTLGPGDTVRIHFRATAYTDHIFLHGKGTDGMDIRVCGVAGPSGELPVIDGNGAITSATHVNWPHDVTLQDLGLVIIGTDGKEMFGTRPSHITIEGLTLRGAFSGYMYTNTAGTTKPWDNFAASIRIQNGDHITVRGCVLTDSGQGIFVQSQSNTGSEGSLSKEILLEGNELSGNGVSGHDTEHNAYMQALGMTAQFNHFGRQRAGAIGGNLKDRSSGTVIRYNWIEGTARMLDLVDAQDQATDALLDPRYHSTFVYGNVLISEAGDGPHVVHYGGDTTGFEQNFRKGTLYFYNNTVILTHDATEVFNSVLLELSTNDENCDFRNNIVFKSGTTNMNLMLDAGHTTLGVNWITDGFAPGVPMRFTGTLTGMANVIGGTTPMIDPTTLRPLAGSPVLDKEQVLADPALSFPVENEYEKGEGGSVRAITGTAMDLGALELK